MLNDFHNAGEIGAKAAGVFGEDPAGGEWDCSQGGGDRMAAPETSPAL